MSGLLTNPPFEEWVRHMFDHPITDPAWHEDAEDMELEPGLLVEYAARLFGNASELLALYTDAQINQGLWFLIGESTSELYALTDSAVALDERVYCIHAIAAVYEQCFLPRCTPHLSHLDEEGTGALNSVCYMWWDIFPLYGQPEDVARREIDAACLAVMEESLQLPSPSCQESALHGLGHWGSYYPAQCRRIISAFMDGHDELREELRDYAAAAREGYIQ